MGEQMCSHMWNLTKNLLKAQGTLLNYILLHKWIHFIHERTYISI